MTSLAATPLRGGRRVDRRSTSAAVDLAARTAAGRDDAVSARRSPRPLAAGGQSLEQPARQGAAEAGLVVADPVARQAGDVADPARGRAVHGDDPRRRGDARRPRSPGGRRRTSSRSTPTSPRSAAAPTRSSATSSASGCSVCPASPRSIATCRSATWKPRVRRSLTTSAAAPDARTGTPRRRTTTTKCGCLLIPSASSPISSSSAR